MLQYILFNKPYGVLSQFTGEQGDKTLSDFNLPKQIYPAGRLDKDSEGLLLLTNDGSFNQRITNPKNNKLKTYWAQVEGLPSKESLVQFRNGLKIKDYRTRPAEIRIIEPDIADREPPIRYRKSIPTTWLEIKISEGKNRQVRRMTAAIGHPTLRLIRVAIGDYQLKELAAGKWVKFKP